MAHKLFAFKVTEETRPEEDVRDAKDSETRDAWKERSKAIAVYCTEKSFLKLSYGDGSLYC